MNNAARFSAEMMRHYDEFGPRYTSYPTAAQFDSDFDEQDLTRQIKISNSELIPRPLSIYLHIPFCRSPCFYCGCTRVITRDGRRAERYVERLLVEIERISRLFDRDREVVQVHFGGGTPNFLGGSQLAEIFRSLDRSFNLSDAADRDFSIELDPRHTKPSDIECFARLGFNRASFGVQDFDAQVQDAVNRKQSVEQTIAAIDACRRVRMDSVNVDLIYGLPRQSLAGFAATLDTVISARPDRLAVYGYAHMPQLFKAQRQIAPGELPGREERLELLGLAVDRLTGAGYVYIGMDHFALPDDPLAIEQRAGRLHRNFMGYTTHADCDLIGLGLSAISHIGRSFSQNEKDMRLWESAIDEGRLPVARGVRLTPDDELRGRIIQDVMCRGCVDAVEIETRFGIEFAAYFSAELDRLQALADDGLLEFDGRYLRVTSQGRYLFRIIASCFDRYLNSGATGTSDRRRQTTG